MNVTGQVIGAENLVECLAGEAVDLPTEIKYDAVFSSGVFPYFTDLNYAEKVLDRMVTKAKHSVGILRMLNADTKDEYLAYRRANTKKFDKHHMEGFWNEPFNFDCFLYRKSAG